MKEIIGDKRTIILMVVVVALVSLNLYLYSEMIQTRSALSEARDELDSVSGIIVSQDRFLDESGEIRCIGLLRLTSDDDVNGVEAGEMSDYRMISDPYIELEAGNLVIGRPMREEPPSLHVRSVIPFFLPPIVNTGEYVDFDVRLNTVGPSLSLGLHNLGERDIIAVRAEVNGTSIPFFFGVDKEHPVKPYGYLHDTVPTNWFDPALNSTKGFRPVQGETYPVDVKLTFSDDWHNYHTKTVKTWNFSRTAVSVYTGGLFVPDESIIHIKSACLIGKTGNDDSLSIVVENVWSKSVGNIDILVDDIQVASVKTNLESGDCWVACIGLPFNIYVGSSHNVTVVALTTEGEVAEVSKEVRCERL